MKRFIDFEQYFVLYIVTSTWNESHNIFSVLLCT